VNKTVRESLKFRKGDFFEDLPGVVNEALKEISKDASKGT
jgi:glycerol-3-phosphate responsive antiterminator